jgi:hypothetical protein
MNEHYVEYIRISNLPYTAPGEKIVAFFENLVGPVQGVRNSNLLFIFFPFSLLYFSFFTFEIGFPSSENKRVGRGWGGGGVCSRAPFF